MTHARDRGGAPDAGGPVGTPHHETRRRAGARRNISKRIRLEFGGRTLEAWVLNVSRGGMRLLLDAPLVAGDRFEAHVPLGDELEGEPMRRPVRVVWSDRQADGTIAGVEFLDVRPSVRVPAARELSPEGDGAGGDGAGGDGAAKGGSGEAGGAAAPATPATPATQPPPSSSGGPGRRA